MIVSGVELSTLVHASEVLSKVKRAGRRVLPQIIRETYSFNIENLKGHYGNPIRLLRLKIYGEEDRAFLFKELIEGFDGDSLEEIVSRLEDYLDKKGSLYLRLDKQEAFQGRLVLGGSDPIKIRVSFRGHGVSKREVAEELRRRFRGG